MGGWEITTSSSRRRRRRRSSRSFLALSSIRFRPTQRRRIRSDTRSDGRRSSSLPPMIRYSRSDCGGLDGDLSGTHFAVQEVMISVGRLGIETVDMKPTTRTTPTPQRCSTPPSSPVRTISTSSPYGYKRTVGSSDEEDDDDEFYDDESDDFDDEDGLGESSHGNYWSRYLLPEDQAFRNYDL